MYLSSTGHTCAQARVHIPEADVLALTAFTTAKPASRLVVPFLHDFLVCAHEFQATGPDPVQPEVRCANLACVAVQPPGVRSEKCSVCLTARFCTRSCQVAAWRLRSGSC